MTSSAQAKANKQEDKIGATVSTRTHTLRATHLGALGERDRVGVAAHLALAHGHAVCVRTLGRALDAPAHDETARAVADVHVLLLHARHVERHEHLCGDGDGRGRGGASGCQGARVRVSGSATVVGGDGRRLGVGLTFLPSGDSRKFTLRAAPWRRTGTRRMWRWAWTWNGTTIMTDWSTPGAQEDGPTSISSSSPPAASSSSSASASAPASATATAASPRPRAT